MTVPGFNFIPKKKKNQVKEFNNTPLSFNDKQLLFSKVVSCAKKKLFHFTQI